MNHEHEDLHCQCPRTADFDSAGPAATGRRAFLRTAGLVRMYVNGCEEGRNPSTPAIGVTTLNHSWLLGGYEYAGAVNQIHNGWIGDVRITARPLRIDEFMNA